MLTHIHIRNFKRFADVEFELGQAVVLIGPNNSGKTTALQALALWEIGLRRWNEKYAGRGAPEEQPGVTINRRDLSAIPIPDANLLWRDLRVRSIAAHGAGQQKSRNICIEVVVDGVTEGRAWSCGLEFDYANDESFYCRPLRLSDDNPPKRMPVPPEAASIRVAFLPPMSGLADREFIKQAGEIGVLVGQGQTAQVLRNLCYQVYGELGALTQEMAHLREARVSYGERQPEFSGSPEWQELAQHIRRLFGVTLLPPKYVKERSELTMAYVEPGGTTLDLSSAGRGLHQTLLLLAYLYANPRTVLLLDEPDAHLEVLRQRQIYQLITEVAQKQGSQIVAASHSEIVLNEAAGRDTVIAFVGAPHRMDDRGSHVLKALTAIGFDQYYQAEQTGWALYVEGSTDLAILQALAATLEHPAAQALARPFVVYVGSNVPQKAREHFYGLREGKADFVGVAIFDRLERKLQAGQPLAELMWQRREIENYLCQREVLLAYARHDLPDDLFGLTERERRERAMDEAIAEVTQALETLGRPSPWSPDIKASDDFLDPVFDRYFRKLGLPNLMRKTDYHVLASLTPRAQIDVEVIEKLDAIVQASEQARPRMA
ncbi:MAG TPA: AAA family ATPase [Anaerolineae bacterium]|nr:AAA family ATPase [Anaerolineae bacterium]